MRVGILLPRLSGGGAEFVASQWAAYLAAAGHRVTLVTTHSTGEQPPPGTSVVALTAPSFAPRLRQLSAHLDRADHDVLLSLMPHWNVLALLATRHRRGHRPAVVISGRNIEANLRPGQGVSYRAELALSRLLYKQADGYVAVSHPVAAEAVSRYGIDLTRLWIVPNPSLAKAGGHGRPRRTASAPRTGPRTVTLTVPARLVGQKRPELAVRTAALLRDEHGVRATVDFFGQGPAADQVRATAARLEVPVRLHGWVPAWFDAAADDAVVLLPSLAEGCPNALVEAAAVGIASVASSRALGVADAVVPRVSGILCMGDEPADYAAAVLAAMELPPAPRDGWLGRFSVEESGSLLLQVLETTLARAGGASRSGAAVPVAVPALPVPPTHCS